MKTILSLVLLAGLAFAQNPVERVVTCTTTGSANAYVCTPTPPIAAYVTKQKFRITTNFANTGAATIAVSGLAATPLVKVPGGITTALAANDLRNGQIAEFVFDGTNFQMTSVGGNAPAGGGTIASTTSVLKGDNAGNAVAATSGSDFAPATSGTSMLKGSGSGGFSNASAGTDYMGMGGGTLTGNLLFTDNTYDIGATGATRPRDIFLSRNATIGGTLNLTGHPTLEGVTATGATGTGKLVFDGTPTLATPVIGAATATSLLASGIVDGTSPVTITTTGAAGGGCSLGTASGCNATAYNSGYTYNQHATAATAVRYNLPTAAAGKQFCVANSYNGSAANTGTVSIYGSAAGQYIIFTDGTRSASGGYVISAGAAGDAACVVGVDSTHWQLYVQRGTWTKN
jgi:hypothetical protein